MFKLPFGSRSNLLVALCALVVAAMCLGDSALAGSLSETIRYRLTFNVDLDGRIITGTGVIQVKQSDTTPVLRTMGGAGNEVSGEAVIVDLGPRGTFFSLLRGPKLGLGSLGAPAWLLFQVFADLLKSETDPLAKMRLLKKLHPRRVLQIDEIPMLVRFQDLNNPKTVEQIDPANLATAFGYGVALRDVLIEVTDDPVTLSIQGKIPWLKAMTAHLDGSQYHRENTLANELKASDFYRGGN